VIPQAPGAGRRIPTRMAVATVTALAAGSALVYLIHVLLSSADGSPLALLIAVGWTAACAVTTSLGSRHRIAGLLLTAAALGLVAWNWSTSSSTPAAMRSWASGSAGRCSAPAVAPAGR
jgi:hypothetical protein